MHPRAGLPEPARRLAKLQAGVLSADQALGMGLSRRTVNRMSQEWIHLARGVYFIHSTADGSAPWLARAWAGLIIGGDRSRLGRLTAGHIQGLVDAPSEDIAVLVPAAARPRTRPGFHFVRESPGIRLDSSGNPPCTRIEDTVLDLCELGSPEDVVTWLTRACQRRLAQPTDLQRRIASRRRLRHRKVVQDVLADVSGGSTTHLELRALHDVIRPHGLPEGKRQFRIRATGRIADLAYPDYGVLIELDGRVGHVEEGAWRDRLRDNAHATTGWVTLRFGWWEVTSEPCRVAAQIASVLAGRGWPGGLGSCPACRSGP